MMIVHLLRIDLKKMKHYLTFWVMCGLYCLLIIIITHNKIFNALSLHTPTFIWQNICYTGSLFKIILGALVATGIANEFAYRTIRQNIIDGLIRWQFILSKVLTNALLTLLSMLLVFILALSSMVIYGNGITIDNILSGINPLLGYGVHIFTFMSLSLFIGIITRRAGLAVLLLIAMPLIESAIVYITHLPADISLYLPINTMDELVKTVFSTQSTSNQLQADSIPLLWISIALGWASLFNYMAYLLLKKQTL